MFILFNGIYLNTENVISFRKSPVDRQGKYPIVADHVVHDSSSEDVYSEKFDTKADQDARFDSLATILKVKGQ